MTTLSQAEVIRQKLQDLITNFKSEINSEDLRKKVLALVPCHQLLRELGKALIPEEAKNGAIARILAYFRRYPMVIIGGNELLVISGIQEWPRRVRELRVQHGWSIISGVTAKQMADEIENIDISKMGPDDYILINENQDREAAYRWHIANDIRRKKISVKDKIIEFLRLNIGKQISGEELRYLAADRNEWPRRVRELRTENGWPIVTKNKGRPDLPIGVYVLEADRQSPEHDRSIPDTIRGTVLRRDNYQCTKCSWSHNEWNPSDPRHLELHHIKQHVKGGENKEENLTTLCTVCHDEIHRNDN